MSKKQKSKSRLSQRKVHFTRAKKAITNQAGFIPAVRFLNRVGLPGILDKRGECARFQRTPSDSQFGRILNCSALPLSLSWKQPSIRREAGFGKQHCVQEKSTVYAVKQITIDLDSTLKTCFGHREGAKKGYNDHKRGALSYHPLLAFCVETKEVLQGWLRSGDAYTANGSIEFMKQLLVTLPSYMKIFFRADSGYFGRPLLSYLESLGHRYLVKVKLKNLKKLLIQQNWQPVLHQPGWEWCEFQHRCGDWGSGTSIRGCPAN